MSTLATVVATSKIASLVFGAMASAGCVRQLGKDNPARVAWALFAVWFATFAIGQSILTTYAVVLGKKAPIPCAGDLFFFFGTTMLIAGAITFIRTYRASGFAPGRPYEQPLVAVVATVVLALVGHAVLSPIAAVPQSPGELVVNLGYPVLDFVALVPLVVLLQITLKFRGGRVWTVWATLLVGIASFTVADILFAYFTSLGKESLDPLIELMYVLGYFFAACGAGLQRRLLST